jgi:hypothetical protein
MITVTIAPTTTPAGKLADAEVIFTEGPFAGLRLVGFGLWERRGGGRAVTMPSRSYDVNGQRRTFALLRPATATDGPAADRLRDIISAAYDTHMQTKGAK